MVSRLVWRRQFKPHDNRFRRVFVSNRAALLQPAGFSVCVARLILVQVALSLPLLVSAALLLKSLQNLRAFDTGFGKENVLLASVNPALNGYSKERSASFFDELLAKTRALPGVKSASLASDSPISGGWDQTGIVVEGYTPREGERMSCDATYVSSDYFKSLEIPIVMGRDFDQSDRVGAPKVVIINEKMAKHYFGTVNAIGKRIGLDGTPDQDHRRRS